MEKFKKYAKVIIPILVIGFVVYRSGTALKSISLKEAVHTLKSLSTFDTFFIIMYGLVAQLSLSLYDLVLVKAMKLEIPSKKYLRTGFIASSMNSIIGFGGLAGASLRHVTYRNYTSDHKTLLQNITWMTSASLSGLAFLAILVVVQVFPSMKFLGDKPWIWLVVIGMACFLPGYFLLTYIRARTRKDMDRSTLRQFFRMNTFFSVASLIEWLFAAVVVLILLFMLGIDIHLPTAMGIYVISSIIGVVSFVPGGFGSFDLTFLLGMSFYGVPESETLTVLLMYRIVYYIIPFLLSLFMAVLDLTGATIKKIEDKPFIGPAIETSGVLWSIYRDILSKAGYWALSILVLYAAWLNLTSVFLVPVDERIFSVGVFDFCSDVILMCAIILILHVKGIYHRTKKSFIYVGTALALSIVAHLLKSLDFHESLVLAVVLGVMVAVRKQFQVEDMIVSFFYYIWNTVLAVFVLAGYFMAGTALSTLDQPDNLRTFDSVLGSTVFSAIFIPLVMFAGTYLFNRFRKKEIGMAFNRDTFNGFLRTHKGSSLAHLGYMGDKRMFFSSDGQALILFRKYKNRLIVLGDPSGSKASFSLVLNEFMKAANRLGYVAVFYQIDQSYMHLYHDFGYRFFKLGEEAYVDLDTFVLTEDKKAELKANVQRFESEGYQFEVVNQVNDMQYEEIKQISDEWLGKRKEKGFSIGEFQQAYIQEAPMAIFRDQEGKAVAFATIMPMYQEKKISIDLMRYLPDAPEGTMEAMFTYLLGYAQKQGYRQFNLGMAPLSNVGTQNEAFFAERIAAAVFNNIQYMYSFSGLRKFKEKYHPVWHGKYLAYRKNKTLVASMIMVTRIIRKGNGSREKKNESNVFPHSGRSLSD